MTTHPLIEPLVAEMAAWRHHLHSIPELSLQETMTSAFVEKLCRGFGLAVTRFGPTGIVATIEGRQGPGRAIGIRAELDALPMVERGELVYASCHEGAMHACGHDGHMAMVLGAAKALSVDRDFSGRVHFIFQPAEEGGDGAAKMIAEGLFEKCPCDEIYALHNSTHPLGTVVVHRGVVASSHDRFSIQIEGRGGHAAVPHECRNPLSAAARIVVALESLPARVTDSRAPVVVTVGSVHGGTAGNIIPERAEILGGVRALDRDARARMEVEIRRHVESIARAESVNVELEYDAAYPVTQNAPDVAEHVISAAVSLFGHDAVVVDPKPELWSDDFGNMLNERPGCYFQLGQLDADHPLYCHHPDYDFNDLLLATGASLWVRLVEQRLR